MSAAQPVEGPDARKPPVCRFCEGDGLDPGEGDGKCSWCCGLGVDCADWWWEIAWLRNQLAQIREVQTHAEGEGALLNTCVMCLSDWPCMTYFEGLNP